MTTNISTSRKELESLARQRLKTLELQNRFGHYDIVRSDSGLVVEFALKAAVCKTSGLDFYPQTSRYKVHNLEKLISLANLTTELIQEKSKKEFFDNWSLLSQWNVNFRYQTIGKDEQKVAKQYLDAVAKEGEGVFPWVKKFW